MVRLLLGDFTRGWPEYEYRTFQTETDKRHFRQPLWDGSSLAGKTNSHSRRTRTGRHPAIHPLRGPGERAWRTVLFECQPALASLIERVVGVDEVILAGDALPAFDVQVPLLSIPGILGTTLETIPAKVPYVAAKKEVVERWRRAVAGQASATAGFKIGIVWQGNPKYRADRARSIPLRHFEKLAHDSGVRLISLQVGPGVKQLKGANFALTDLGSRFDLNSLEDLAAALMGLDLLVTSDTAVPHLAGATRFAGLAGVILYSRLALAA